MIIRTINGELIIVDKYKFNNDKLYYLKIMEYKKFFMEYKKSFTKLE